MVSLVMFKNKDVYPIFDLNTEWLKSYKDIEIAQTALLVHKDFEEKHPNKLKLILKDYESSSDWVNKNPKAASELIVKHEVLPNTQVAIASIPRSNLRFKYAYPIKDQIIKYLSVFYNLNPDIVGGKIPDDNFFINLEP